MTAAHPDGRPQPLLDSGDGHIALLLGNEAIVRGALEAGVGFACGYPGTPSSEITDSFARLAGRAGVLFEYSVNEKVALEMAFAAALAGTRSLVAMKHLGLMYAGDPLSTIPYVGVEGGLVIVSAADPSCRTSPNEQDQRLLAPMLHLPTLEPSTPQEALEMTRQAFALSEESRLPVLLRPTTRVCHTRAAVRFGERAQPRRKGFVRNPPRYVPAPTNAQRMRKELPERIERARGVLSKTDWFRREGNSSTAILASGAPAATVADLLASDGALARDEVALWTLGQLFPLPESELLESLRGVDRLLVIEELSPYLEDAVRALCALHGLSVEILGKRTDHLPFEFEYEPHVIAQGLHAALGLGEPAAEPTSSAAEPPIPRPPILCAACPHRAAFFAARLVFDEDTLYFNDIGCYTLGYGPPLETADALLCMGAGFTMADGVSRATGKRTVGFMGDSTFFHSGMPALLNAVKEDSNMVAVIMDNQVVAMTGFQDSLFIEIEGTQVERSIDIEGVVRALGAKDVETVDPDDLGATVQAYARASKRTGLSVLITKRPCPVFYGREIGEAPPVAIELPSAEPIETFTIDPDLCGTCGREACGHRCNQEATPHLDRAMARARALESGRDEARPGTAPCATQCPLHLCVQGYAGHIAAGRYADALELIMDGLPLPDSVCRVCDRPCESACVRGGLDAPVAINDLKRFVMDWDARQGESSYEPDCEPEHGATVAVVGAGPAGLAAAHELRVRGYGVSLYDANEEPGGLLLTGIPRYRLPLEVLRRDVDRVLGIGVHFEGGRRLGEDLALDQLVGEHSGVVLALGSTKPIEAPIPGESALAFLAETREPGATLDGSVLVVGGGNSAIDAARTARRLGAEVTVLCLESREQMPAIASEVGGALEEGVQLLTRTQIVEHNGSEATLVAVEPTDDGPFHPEHFAPVDGSERMVAADRILLALGQRPDLAPLGEEVAVREDSDFLSVDPETGATSNDQIFAAGDLLAGGGSVTGAIASGLRAAWGLDRAIRGNAAADKRQPPPRVDPSTVAGRPGVGRVDESPRIEAPELPGVERAAHFGEVVGAYTEAQARAEAARCMICGLCGNCDACVATFGCPAFFKLDTRFGIDADLCTACGVCAQFCPNDAIHPVSLPVPVAADG